MGPLCANPACAMPFGEPGFWSPCCSCVCAEARATEAAEAFKAAWLEETSGRNVGAAREEAGT